MTAIIKAQPVNDPRDMYIAYMLACYIRAPARPSREEVKRGAITDLGEVGTVPEKNWERLNPYAVATPK
jgi:hypothetical protein